MWESYEIDLRLMRELNHKLFLRNSFAVIRNYWFYNGKVVEEDCGLFDFRSLNSFFFLHGGWCSLVILFFLHKRLEFMHSHTLRTYPFLAVPQPLGRWCLLLRL